MRNEDTGAAALKNTKHITFRDSSVRFERRLRITSQLQPAETDCRYFQIL